ncbi:MAG: hypothetical protein GX491_06485 [Chloroflexi bacterium]|nr:hypothetical protein [Chloroflexota bacterium]
MNQARVFYIIAVVTALFMLPFSFLLAAAYGRAYEPLTAHFLLSPLVRLVPGLFNFTSPAWVYQIFGRVYGFFIPLALPALLMLIKQIPVRSALYRWGSGILVTGVILAGLGIIGEYWDDPDSSILFIGYYLDLLGTLLVWIGGSLTGAAVLRDSQTARWVGFAFLTIPLGSILGLLLTGHIPSGSLFGLVLFTLATGMAQLRGMKVRKGSQPEGELAFSGS